MNKIKKMALEHYKDVLEQEIRTGITMSNITSYELGAKAVLEEIEKILAKDFRSPVNIIMSLRKLVEQLKEK